MDWREGGSEAEGLAEEGEGGLGELVKAAVAMGAEAHSR